jgi:hypothetical protein
MDLDALLSDARALQADLRIGQPYQLRFLGRGGDPWILLLSTTLPRFASVLVEQPLWVLGELTWLPLAANVFDPTGALGFDLQVPLDPGLVDQPVWFHGISGTAFPLQAAPPVGGYKR